MHREDPEEGSTTLIALLGCVFVVLVGFAFWLAGSDTDSKSEVPAEGPAPDEQVEQPGPRRVVGGQAEAAPPRAAGQDPRRENPRGREGSKTPIGFTGAAPKGAVVFPDGRWLWPLNGVKEPQAFPGFARGRPFAPVVQIETADNGEDWYIHADSSTSTTKIGTFTIHHEEVRGAHWIVANPEEALENAKVIDPPGASGAGRGDGKAPSGAKR